MIINNDCIKAIKEMDENSIDTLICDPPYGLSFMGKKWDYDVPSIKVWKECLRVIKPGGTALIFAGSRTQHRMAVNIEDAGWILKDCIMWLYGSGFPKAHDIGKSVEKIKVGGIKNLKQTGTKKGIKVETGTQGYSYNKEYVAGKCMGGKQISGDIPIYEINNEWNGWKSHGLKPAYEPILVAMKPNEGTYANNALKHGVSGLNIDGGRIPLQKDEDTKRVKSGHKTSYIGGEMEKNFDIENQSDRDKGRFPANIILDEKAAEMLDEQSGELGKSKGGNDGVLSNEVYGKYATEKNNQGTGFGDKGGASRFFYCAKASKSERNAGCEGLEAKKIVPYCEKGNRREGRDGTGTYLPRQNTHPTVKPIALMEYLCTLTRTPTGGKVLDPFMGSGTTGVACINTDREFIGIEKEAEYIKIAEARIKHAIKKRESKLF